MQKMDLFAPDEAEHMKLGSGERIAISTARAKAEAGGIVFVDDNTNKSKQQRSKSGGRPNYACWSTSNSNKGGREK